MKKPSNNPGDNSEIRGSIPQESMTRRDFLITATQRVAALAAVGVLADSLTGNQAGNQASDFIIRHLLPANNAHDEETISTEDAEAVLKEIEAKVEEMKTEATEYVEKSCPEASDHEKAMRIIDYMGCAVFASGIGSLLSGGHIYMAHYAAFLGVLAAKYALSNDQERAHLTAEMKANAKAGILIAGTVVAAEGIKANLDGEVYEKLARREATDRDKVALLCLLAGTASPLVTTLGSATLCQKMAVDLADGNHDRAAVLMQYIANSSGFLLFGDPPFIAICEEYGYAEGLLWQARTMWPMALYSMASSAFKLNMYRAEAAGMPVAQRTKWALRETASGLKDNIGVLARLVKATLGNAFTYATGQDLRKGTVQSDTGIEFDVESVLAAKLAGAMHFLKREIDSSGHHEDAKGFDADSPKEAARESIIKAAFDSQLSEDKKTSPAYKKLSRAIEDKDSEAIHTAAEGLGIDKGKIDTILMMLDGSKYESCWEAYTNLNNLKGAIGHNLGDIIDVFPFQAGCVPFLMTFFADANEMIESIVETMDGVPERIKKTLHEGLLFILIMMFSSIADNYVACKLGLEIKPDNPELALVPSIIGGGMSTAGNMANLALFTLDEMPLATSFLKDKLHLDIALAGFAWTQLMPKLQGHPVAKLLFGEGIKPLATTGGH